MTAPTARAGGPSRRQARGGQRGYPDPARGGQDERHGALNELVDEFAKTVNVRLTHFVSAAESEILQFIHEQADPYFGTRIRG